MTGKRHKSMTKDKKWSQWDPQHLQKRAKQAQRDRKNYHKDIQNDYGHKNDYREKLNNH